MLFNEKTKSLRSIAGQMLVLVSFLWLAVSQTPAADLTVTKTADTNDGACNADCSLREAIAAAAGGDTIVFGALFNSFQSIVLSGGELLINKSLTIRGTSAAPPRINGNNAGRVFNVNGASGTIVNLSNLEINNGNAGTGFGGGVLLNTGNTLNLSEVTVNSNRATRGGGIYTMPASVLNITRSTIYSNTAILTSQSIGGGIFNSGATNISNSTVTINQSSNVGSGIISSSDNGSLLTLNNVTVSHNSGISSAVASNGTTNLRNTIIAANTAISGSAPDINGPFVSFGNNLIGDNTTFSGTNFPAGTPNANGDFVGTSDAPLDPLLDGISNNGGPTATRALLAGSFAINNGNNCVVTASCPSNNPAFPLETDQRGNYFLRRLQGTVDIGAYEFGTIRVNGPTDSGIRNAIANAPAGGAINFSAIVSNPACVQGVCTINLTAGELLVNKSLTIIGTGARSLIIRRSAAGGTPELRIFRVTGSGIVVNISDLTVSSGFLGALSERGGGIFNGNGATLNLDRLIVRNNTSNHGAGVYNDGATLNISNSTISHNTGNGTGPNGGGVNNNGGGTMNISNSTISDNSATFGGGILNASTLILNNSTVSHNTATSKGGGVSNLTNASKTRNTIIAANASPSSPDAEGPFNSLGNNLIGSSNGSTGFTNGVNGDTVGTNTARVNPQLDALQNNGGPTDTRALLAGSPALNRGNNCVTDLSCPANNPPVTLANDQRGAGFPRIFSNFIDIGAFEANTSQRRAPFDFDGDNKTDISIFRPSAGEWWYLKSSNGANAALQFGTSTDRLAPGDYTGDGKTDIAFFRPSNGSWFILRSEDNSFFSFPFGANGDVPVPADYDGDGKADAAVFRPSSATWFIQNSGGGISIINFGAMGDAPVTADYDGDGRADIAIFRPSDGSWWYLRSSDASFRVFRFGVSTDKPVPGDFTGDGRADIAVFRPVSGEWFVQRSEDNSFYSFPFGASGDVPAPGDYDGDGKFDAAVFRPSEANWYIQRSTAGILIQQFGLTSDRPVPSAFVTP